VEGEDEAPNIRRVVILPLAVLIHALVAGGKAVALGAASGAPSYGAKKAFKAVTCKRRRRQKTLVLTRHVHKRSCPRGRYNDDDVIPSRRNELNGVVLCFVANLVCSTKSPEV